MFHHQYKGPIVSICLNTDHRHGQMWTGPLSENTAISFMKAAIRLGRHFPSTWGGAIEVIKITPSDDQDTRYYEVKIVLRDCKSNRSDPEKLEAAFTFRPHPYKTLRKQTNYRELIRDFVSEAKKAIAAALERKRNQLLYSVANWDHVLKPQDPKAPFREL